MRVVKELVAINRVIAALEHAGYAVDMEHDHFPYGFYHDNNHALLCTTSTHLSIAYIGEDGELYEQYVGRADCSAKDQFSPREGAQIAFGRAISAMSKELGREYLSNLIEDYEIFMEMVEQSD